jgi:hypothetical protein
MDQPRKIVVILGNGFDIDLGLKTSYKDFWESEYCPKNYPAPLIRHLNSKWGDNLESVRWYDLENELHEYALNGDKTDVINEAERSYILNNNDYLINNQLTYLGVPDEFNTLVKKGYIQVSDNRLVERARVPYHGDFSFSVLERDNIAFQLIKERLRNYLHTLGRDEKYTSSISYQVLALLDEEAVKGDYVNLFSFNYTPLLVMNRTPDAAKVFYVHGSCKEGRIIVGTRDEKLLNEDYDFLQKSFDPAYNPPALVDDLKDADEVIFFGHSIGENDRQYFKAFFKQQTEYLHPRRINITIFTRDDSSETQIRRALQKMTDWNLSTLFGQNNLQIIKTQNLKEDQEKLFNFLVKHGKDELATREFIGKHLN